MREAMKKPEKGAALLLQHVTALSEPRRSQTAFERLSAKVGGDLAGMLVHALSGDHRMRRVA
jgi:hypothetical protein